MQRCDDGIGVTIARSQLTAVGLSVLREYEDEGSAERWAEMTAWVPGQVMHNAVPLLERLPKTMEPTPFAGKPLRVPSLVEP